jgi:hypothetical protein
MFFVFLFAAQKAAVAQFSGNDIRLRVGKGTSVTAHGSTSLYLSIPSHQLTGGRGSSLVYLDESIALSQSRNTLDFIIGAAPMAQFELAHDAPRLSIEAGVGLNYISAREMDGRQLGSHFLFSPTAAGGIELPWMNSLLGIFYMFRHLSNAGIYRDNDGINFQYIVFSVRFRGS